MLNNQFSSTSKNKNTGFGQSTSEKLFLADSKGSESPKPKLYSWKKIKESTSAFFNSEGNIYRNMTTTFHNLELNNKLMEDNGVRSMFIRGSPPPSPCKKCTKSLDDDRTGSPSDFRGEFKSKSNFDKNVF